MRNNNIPDISSGFGIGGYGSDDHNIWIEIDNFPDVDQPGDIVTPAGSTMGYRGKPDDVCNYPGCHRIADYNPNAGQSLCARHWDEY